MMGKNNKLINQYKYMYQKIQEITPEVYAGIALALRRKHGWGYKRINDLFQESQEIWQECVEYDMGIIQMCFNETGIDVQRRTNEKSTTK